MAKNKPNLKSKSPKELIEYMEAHPNSRGAVSRIMKDRMEEFNKYFDTLSSTEEQSIQTNFPFLFE